MKQLQVTAAVGYLIQGDLKREQVERLAREFRTQKIIFEVARDVYDQMQKHWKGSKEALLAQLVRLVEPE